MARHRTAAEKVLLGEQARALRAAGRSRREIMAELGIGEDLLSVLVRGTDVPSTLRRPRAKDELRAVARELYRQGRSYRELERELGVSRSSLSLWLRDLRVAEGVLSLGNPDHSNADAASPVPGGVGDGRRESACRMRLEGRLLKEIAAELGVSVGTIHRWVRDLPVPAAARPGGNPEHMHRMRRAYWDPILLVREAQRQTVMAAAAVGVVSLSPRELELLGVASYWCEGRKSKPWRRQENVQFINSDPGLIRLFLAYLRLRGVADSQLYLHVSIHERADVHRATRYWADVVGLPAQSFRPPTLKRHNPKTVRKNTGEDYVGCLVIGVRQSRLLYQHIAGTWQGMMEAVTAAEAAVA